MDYLFSIVIFCLLAVWFVKDVSDGWKEGRENEKRERMIYAGRVNEILIKLDRSKNFRANAYGDEYQILRIDVKPWEKTVAMDFIEHSGILKEAKKRNYKKTIVDFGEGGYRWNIEAINNRVGSLCNP